MQRNQTGPGEQHRTHPEETQEKREDRQSLTANQNSKRLDMYHA